MNNDELRRRAERIAKEKLDFQVHLVIYIAVNLFLIAIWYFTSRPYGTFFPWFIFPLFGWGIGIVAHFLAVYLGESRMSQKVEKEYQRLKRQKIE